MVKTYQSHGRKAGLAGVKMHIREKDNYDGKKDTGEKSDPEIVIFWEKRFFSLSGFKVGMAMFATNSPDRDGFFAEGAFDGFFDNTHILIWSKSIMGINIKKTGWGGIIVRCLFFFFDFPGGWFKADSFGVFVDRAVDFNFAELFFEFLEIVG